MNMTYCKDCNSKEIRLDHNLQPYCRNCGGYNLETIRI